MISLFLFVRIMQGVCNVGKPGLKAVKSRSCNKNVVVRKFRVKVVNRFRFV